MGDPRSINNVYYLVRLNNSLFVTRQSLPVSRKALVGNIISDAVLIRIQLCY